MAVKFDPDPSLEEAQGSPYTASLAFKVFNLLVEYCQSDGKEKKRKSGCFGRRLMKPGLKLGFYYKD